MTTFTVLHLVKRLGILPTLALATLFASCSTADQPRPASGAPAVVPERSLAYERAVSRRKPEDPKLVWTPTNVVLMARPLAPGVFAVFPDDAEQKNAAGIPVATSGGFVIGDSGVLLIDTMINRDLAEQVLQLVKERTDKPILFAVNTSYHGDHSYGNQFLPSSAKIIQHEKTQAYIQSSFAKDVAFMTQNFGSESGLQELTAQPAAVLLRDGESRDIDLGGKVVRIAHIGFAQTEGDLFVSVPAANVVFTGNPVISGGPSLPWLLDGHHGDAIATLERLRSIFPDDVTVVPGHGAPTTRAAIDRHIEYLRDLGREVSSAIAAQLDAKQTAQQVSERMGAQYGDYRIYPWVHTQVNVSKVYEELTRKPAR